MHKEREYGQTAIGCDDTILNLSYYKYLSISQNR